MFNWLFIPVAVQAERLLRWALCCLLLLIIIPSGSVNFIPFHRLAAALYAVAAIAIVLCRPSGATRGPFALGLGLALVLGAWILIQSLSFDGNPFGNPVWADVTAVLGTVPQSISVSPGDTRAGITAAVLPFAVFVTTLLLFSTDKQALALIRTIVFCGAAIGIFGLIQFSFYPKMLGFGVKRFYLNSLTTVFVNRNTAANYLGMVMIFSTGLALHSLQSVGWRNLVAFLVAGHGRIARANVLWFFTFAFATAVAFVALMLTQSRAGIACSLVGLGLMISITALSDSGAQTSRYGFSQRPLTLRARMKKVGLIFAVIAVLGFVFAGLAIIRVATVGGSDLRFCFFPRLIDMLRDNWLVGSGFGTFRDVYPAYRNPACGMDGVLTLAHNVFLEGWISLGLPFVAICVLSIAALFSSSITGIRNRRKLRWVPAAGLGVLVLQILHNCVDFSIQNPGIGVLFAALMGSVVVISLGRQPDRARKSTDVPAAAV